MEATIDPIERVVYTIPEFCRMTGISRNLGYQLAQSGRIPTIRLGKRLVISKVAFQRMMEEGFDPSNL